MPAQLTMHYLQPPIALVVPEIELGASATKAPPAA